MTDGYTITRTFDAPRELVYSMFTTPEHFSVWWGGDQVVVPLESITLDPREGGDWKSTMVGPDGAWTIDWVGTFHEATPYSRLSWDFTDDASNPQRDLITVDLTEVDGATEVVLSQTGGGLTPEQYLEARAGTDSFLSVMQQYLGRLQQN